MSNDVTNFAASLVEMAKAMERVPELEREVTDLNEIATERLFELIERDKALEASRRYAASLEQRCHDLEVSRDAAELRFLEADDVVSTIKSVLRRTMEDTDSALKAIEPVVEPTPDVAFDVGTMTPIEPVAETYTYEDAVRGMENVVEAPSPSPFPDTTPSTAPSADEGIFKVDMEWSAAEDKGKSETPFAPTSTPPNPAHLSPVTTSDVGSSQTEAADAKPKGPYFGRNYMSVPGFISRLDWLAGGGTNEGYDWRP